MGFETVPAVGSRVAGTEDVLEQLKPNVPVAQTGEQRIKVILKADVAGSLEAIANSLGEYVAVMEKGVGDISESDVLLASTMGARIVGFHVAVPKSVQTLADDQAVRIKTYRIIYDLLEDIEKLVDFMLHPGKDEEEIGTAEIVAEFSIRGDHIAGCKVKTGEIKRGLTMLFRLKRGEQVIAEPKIKSLKQGKQDVEVMKAPGECGIVFRGGVEFAIGDTLICYTKKVV
jgi:translation initiation factor IF-2